MELHAVNELLGILGPSQVGMRDCSHAAQWCKNLFIKKFLIKNLMLNEHLSVIQ